jgi:hypothetical protein
VASSPDLAWLPVATQEKEQVLAQLQKLMASHAFRNSQRYPALLRYVVEQTLAGEANRLKERTLGIAVFHRAADYDTNADPVVRISAGEVRKRLAQYYQEHPQELRIDLPPGSYVPHFQPAPSRTAFLARDEADGTIVPVDSRNAELGAAAETVVPATSLAPAELLRAAKTARRRAIFRPGVYLAFAPLVLLLIAALTLVTMQREKTHTAVHEFWAPLAQPGGSLLLVIGDHLVPFTSVGHLAQEFAEPLDPETGTPSRTLPPLALLPIGDALAIARVTAVLGSEGIHFDAKGESRTSLNDLRSHPAVLFGAFNNQWSQHATRNLRFRFARDYGPDGSQIVSIVDTAAGTASAAKRKWAITWSQPLAAKTEDYALIARFFDPENEKEVVVIAGLGENGTVAAGEFVTKSRYLVQLDALTPSGRWARRNLEAVIATPVVNGVSGPPHVEAAYFW